MAEEGDAPKKRTFKKCSLTDRFWGLGFRVIEGLPLLLVCRRMLRLCRSPLTPKLETLKALIPQI